MSAADEVRQRLAVGRPAHAGAETLVDGLDERRRLSGGEVEDDEVEEALDRRRAGPPGRIEVRTARAVGRKPVHVEAGFRSQDACLARGDVDDPEVRKVVVAGRKGRRVPGRRGGGRWCRRRGGAGAQEDDRRARRLRLRLAGLRRRAGALLEVLLLHSRGMQPDRDRAPVGCPARGLESHPAPRPGRRQQPGRFAPGIPDPELRKAPAIRKEREALSVGRPRGAPVVPFRLGHVPPLVPTGRGDPDVAAHAHVGAAGRREHRVLVVGARLEPLRIADGVGHPVAGGREIAAALDVEARGGNGVGDRQGPQRRRRLRRPRAEGGGEEDRAGRRRVYARLEGPHFASFPNACASIERRLPKPPRGSSRKSPSSSRRNRRRFGFEVAPGARRPFES